MFIWTCLLLVLDYRIQSLIYCFDKKKFSNIVNLVTHIKLWISILFFFWTTNIYSNNCVVYVVIHFISVAISEHIMNPTVNSMSPSVFNLICMQKFISISVHSSPNRVRKKLLIMNSLPLVNALVKRKPNPD